MSKLLRKTEVPEGKSGDWAIARFTITEEQARTDAIRSIYSGYGYRSVRAGTFTKLTRNGHVIASDTRAELRDYTIAVHHAEGQVLINGLGLGLVIEACLRRLEVDHVTVIEIAEDVIKLVKPYLQRKYSNSRLTIIHADALTWKPPKGMIYDMVYHDIWDSICEDNWETMTKLHRRYGKRCKWQGSWCQWEVQRLRKEGLRGRDRLIW